MSINKKYVLAGVVASSIMLHTGISTVFADTEYRVITGDSVNFRSGAGTNFPVTATVKKNEVYTIVEEKNGWGKLKSGIGWINLNSKYVQKL